MIILFMNEGIHLDRIINELISEQALTLCVEEVIWLCKGVSNIFLDEPSLLEIEPPVNICGDIHGQFGDLIRVLQSSDFTPDTKYLFLGDYVDRGDQSLEVICLLFAMKMRFPDNVYLLRGNHESPEMTEAFGFAEECEEKLEFAVLGHFLDAFDCLPVAAVVGGKLFCVHGGLSPVMKNLHEVKAIERPCGVPEDGILADLLWSDPSRATIEWGPNDRGATYTWGLKVAKEFMEANGIERIIRAHQMAFGGYDFPFSPDRSVITVFTASSYANRYKNSAAFITVNNELKLQFTVLEPILREPDLQLLHVEPGSEAGQCENEFYEGEDFDIGHVNRMELDAQ